MQTFINKVDDVIPKLLKLDRDVIDRVEKWKIIPNTENKYLVSNKGNVMSLGRYTNNRNGKYFRKGKKLKPQENNKGYLYVYLSISNGERKEYVHRLVALTFIENVNNKPYVNHIDCNPKNNNVNNLEWCTPKENTRYMISLNRNKRTKIWLDRLHKSTEKYKKSVVRINPNTLETKKYAFLNQVKTDGFRPGDVCKCCKGERKTAGGYEWRYVNEFIQ